LTRDREPAFGATPPAPDSKEPVPAPRARVYEPPAVLWEQPFVALAQVSFDDDYGCDIPGSCSDLP
jgi:hypothetical protein